MKKSVLITGGSGLLAINWAISIRNQHFVTLGLHTRDVQLSSTKSTRIDLESESNLIRQLQTLKTEIVIHTAGLTSVERCEADPKLAYRVNVTLASNIARACHQLQIPFVHISTDHLFSGMDLLVDETYPVAPVNTYGKTKAEAESQVLNYYPMALILRTNFYGWGTRYRHSFSDTIINSMRTKKTLTLFNDVAYSPILAETLAQTAHDLLDRQASGIFNVVGDDRLTKYEFGQQLAKYFQLNADSLEVSRFADETKLVRRPLDMSLSNRKVCELLGRRIGSIGDQLEQLRLQEINGQAREIQSI